MVSRSFLHIGFGKCASTTLQRRVFPVVATDKGYRYLFADEVGFFDHEAGADIAGAQDGGRQPILGSDERIVGIGTAEWAARADRLKEKFGNDISILIVIREPKAFFRSVYQQDALHQLPIRTVDEFFTGGRPGPFANVPGVDFRTFDFDELLAIYQSRFKHVVVQKFESVLNLEFLREFMDLTDEDLASLQAAARKRSSNRSYSASAARLTLKMAGFLNANMPEPNALGRIPKTRKSRVWRMLMRDFYDKIVPYEKLEIDWSRDVFRDLDRICAQYERLPDIQVLRG